MQLVASLAAVVAMIAALAHVGWAFGRGRGSSMTAIPTTTDGRPVMDPGMAVTLAVAGLLATFATVVLLAAWWTGEPPLVRLMVGVAAGLLSIRVIGDRRYVGLTKQVRDTTFSRLDDRVFTPVIVLLVVGAVAALAV